MMSPFKRLILSLLALSAMAFADAVTTEAVSHNGAVIRDRQLRNIGEILEVGRGGYFDVGVYYTPVPTQAPLKSKFGEHEGFAHRLYASAFGTHQLSPDSHIGGVLMFERSGWDGEDFAFWPNYGQFSLVRSMTTGGLVYTRKDIGLSVAGGMQFSNVEYVGLPYAAEEDSLLYSWAHVRFGAVALQASLNKSELRHLRFSLNMESKQIQGGKSSGWRTYLPNFDLALYRGNEEDSLRLIWNQNIYDQRLYGEVVLDFPNNTFHSAALKFYPDPSRFVSAEVNCLRRPNGKLLWGGALDLWFLRFGYNTSFDYDNFMGSKGTFIAEIKFTMGMVDGLMFGRGAAKHIEMETSLLQKKKGENFDPSKLKDAPAKETPAAKTITAKGVRYEKSGAASSEGGNK